MNINEVINKIVRNLLNETYFNTDSVPGPYKANRTIQLLHDYINSFPPRTSNFVIPYVNLNPKQKNILALIAECNGTTLQKVLDTVYYRYAKLKTTKDIAIVPDDFLGEFLTADTRENVYVTQGERDSEAQFGMALVVGKYLNDYRNRIDYTHFIKYLSKALIKSYITCIESQLKNRVDSPLRSDLFLPTAGNSVSYNDAFKNQEENILQTILNDKNIRLKPQERTILQAFMEVCGSSLSPENLEALADYHDTRIAKGSDGKYTKETQVIYKEISERTGVPPITVAKVLSGIVSQLKKSKYSNYNWNSKLNIVSPNAQQPEQITNNVPTTQPKQVTNRVPNPQQTFTQKMTKAAPVQQQPTQKLRPKKKQNNYTISGATPTDNYTTMTESNNKIQNKNKMRKKIQLTESVLKQMIIRAINESLYEVGKPGNAWESIKKWALAVRNGADPIHCKEFNDFYATIIENPYCENAVKMGFAYESKNQSSVGGNTTLNIDKMFAVRPKIASDVLTDFLTGENCIVKENSKPDSFVGDNVTNCAMAALNGETSDFFNVLCKQLRTYGAHYCRKHYGELSMQWGLGAQQIGGDKSNALEDEENSDYIEDVNEPGKDIEIDAGNKVERDPYSGEEVDDSNVGFDKAADVTSVKNDYDARMVRQLRKIINDPQTTLAPQEKKVLKAIIYIKSHGVSDDRLEKMQGASETQQRQILYDQVGEMLGMPVINVQRSISSAISKARQSKFAKMDNVDEQRKQKLNQLINEVIRKVMKKYLG